MRLWSIMHFKICKWLNLAVSHRLCKSIGYLSIGYLSIGYSSIHFLSLAFFLLLLLSFPCFFLKILGYLHKRQKSSLIKVLKEKKCRKRSLTKDFLFLL